MAIASLSRLCLLLPAMCGPGPAPPTFEICPDSYAKMCPPDAYCTMIHGHYDCVCRKAGLHFCPRTKKCLSDCAPAGDPKSCLDWKNAGASTNGVYKIITPSGDVETFCDMKQGGWTLIGQADGDGDIYDFWLRSNTNTENLATTALEDSVTSCIDAIDLAVNHATMIRFGSGDNPDGMGSIWVEWDLPDGREVKTFWNHEVGQSTVMAEPQTKIEWRNSRGDTFKQQYDKCYHNKYGIHTHPARSGGYPTMNRNDGTASNDWCFTIAVMNSALDNGGPVATSPVHGYHNNNAYGFDAPAGIDDWPNDYWGRMHSVNVWVL